MSDLPNSATTFLGGEGMPSLRALAHDLRSLLGAATTNLEYIQSIDGLPAEAIEVTEEVENELRLAADVLDVYAGSHAKDRVVELDLRAPLWLARSHRRITIDATTAPWPVRGEFGAIEALVAAILSAVPPSRPTNVEVGPSALVIAPLDPVAMLAIAAPAATVGLVAVAAGTTVTLERATRA